MYELTFLVNPNISEADFANVVKQLKDFIARTGGQITKDFFSRKIYLAYPIKKIKQAFLVSVEFKTDRDKIESIKQQIKDIKSIIRHLVITKYPEKIKPVSVKAKRPKIKTKAKEKIKIEELDKKLEEILEE